MSEEQRERAARRPDPAERTDEQKQADKAAPITTGDMQKVGALTPEEVPARRRVKPAEAPVEEDPGDQNSG